MITLFFQLGKLFLAILPDTQAHLNGHAIITYTYTLYKTNQNHELITLEKKTTTQHLADNDDPDYYGQITFELPDKLFNYSPGSNNMLDREQLEQVIEFISEVRNNPSSWVNFEN